MQKFPTESTASAAAMAPALQAHQLEQALASANVGIWVWDLAQNTRVRTKTADRLLGLDQKQEQAFKPENFAELVSQAVHPDDRERVKKSVPDALASKSNDYQIEYRVIWKDGSTHYLTTRGQITRDADGKPMQIVGATLDITTVKQLSQEAQIHQRRLQEFVEYVCHEIRNPLHGVFGGHEWLRTIYRSFSEIQPGSPQYSKVLAELRESMRMLHQCAEQMQGSIDVLDENRVVAQISKRSFDPKRTIDHVLTPLKYELVQKNISIKLALGHADKLIEGNETFFSQVLNDLLLKVIKLNLVQITITTSFATLAAPNPPEQQPAPPTVVIHPTAAVTQTDAKLNQKYFKCVIAIDAPPAVSSGGQTIRSCPKTEYDLTIAQRLVELMGGKIAISDGKEGTTFAFTMSCKVLGDSPIHHRKSLCQTAVPDFSGRNILVVDDSDINRRILARVLNHTKCTIHLAANGLEAVEFFRPNHPSSDEKSGTGASTKISQKVFIDLVFMDVIMPVMGGLEATRQILAMGRPVPIVGVSANSGVKDRKKAKDAGMSDYLTKPFLNEDLYAAARQALFPNSVGHHPPPSPLLLGTPCSALAPADDAQHPPTKRASLKISSPHGGASSSQTFFASATVAALPQPTGTPSMKRDSPPGSDVKVERGGVSLAVVQPNAAAVNKKNTWYNFWNSFANCCIAVRDCDCNCASCGCSDTGKVLPRPAP